jgi:hypothetical protein
MAAAQAAMMNISTLNTTKAEAKPEPKIEEKVKENKIV